ASTGPTRAGRGPGGAPPRKKRRLAMARRCRDRDEPAIARLSSLDELGPAYRAGPRLPETLADQRGDPGPLHRPARHIRRGEAGCQDRPAANCRPSGADRLPLDNIGRHVDLSVPPLPPTWSPGIGDQASGPSAGPPNPAGGGRSAPHHYEIPADRTAPHTVRMRFGPAGGAVRNRLASP